jgi:hypothetical protein
MKMNNELRQADMDLQRELKGLVDFETSHIHSNVLTDKIVRAVRQSTVNGWSLEERLSGALMSWFRPVALVGTLLVLLLAGYNVTQSDDSYQMSTTERVFGFHSVTLAAAYDLDLESSSDDK